MTLKENNKIIGNIINKLKKLNRYDLWWEQMNESKNGEYLKYEDVFNILKNLIKNNI